MAVNDYHHLSVLTKLCSLYFTINIIVSPTFGIKIKKNA